MDEKVERIQYLGVLAITGAWQGTSRSKIYDELCWGTRFDRRKFRRVHPWQILFAKGERACIILNHDI